MKKKLFAFLFCCIPFAVFSQNEIIRGEPDGTIVGGVYNCKILEWKIKIPDNYQVMEIGVLEQKHLDGIKELRSKNPDALISEKRINLISFQKDKDNFFSSSYSTLENHEIKFEDHKTMFYNLLSNSLDKIKNGRFTKTISEINIGKQRFYRIKVEGYNLNNQLVLSQIYYNAIIKENLFGVLINYSNSAEGNTMEEIFLKSFL